MFSLEMLTKAADLVETRDKQKQLTESPSPASDSGKPTNSSEETEKSNRNGRCNKDDSGRESEEIHQPKMENGQNHKADSANDAKNVNGHRTTRELETQPEIVPHFQTRTSLSRELENQCQSRDTERTNGLSRRKENRHSEEGPTRTWSREYQHQTDRKSVSPSADKGGDNHHLTKPMVLLQQPSPATLSSVGSIHPVSAANPSLQTAAMHHSYLYPMMYHTGASLDTLGLVNRVPAGAHKESEGHATTPNGSPNASLAPVSAPMHLPAGFMYPFANQALMMGGAAGGIADISPFLLAQTQAAYASAAGVPSNLAVFDQYKRLLEGSVPQMPPYHLPPHLAEYFKSLTSQGVEMPKDAVSLSALGRLGPTGIPLTALQGHPSASDLWLRYTEHLNPGVGMIRPSDGVSPRSGSPYASKRRSESPAIPNGVKASTSAYPYHGSLSQPQNSASRVQSRSPASIFSHGQRSRSPNSDARKAEVERANFRAHSRDLDREGKPLVRDIGIARDLASTSAPNHSRNTIDHHTFSVTDENGRKIAIPYPHIPHGYHGIPAHHTVHERSPSPQSRASDDMRAYRRTSRERSPGGDQLANKRRSFEAQYGARQSPATNDRQSSRPQSPLTNGQPATTRHQMPHVNGSTEVPNPHPLLLGHGSPNALGFAESREQRGGSPATNPYFTGGMPSYMTPQLISGLAGQTPLFLPHYAQALAASAKGSDLSSLTSLYKPGENGPEYSRMPGLPLSMATLPLLPQQQQQLFATAGRSSVLTPEYAAALKQEYLSTLAGAKDAAKSRDPIKPAFAQEYAALKAREYFTSLTGAKDSGKDSPVNGREKHAAPPQSIHPSLLHPGPAMSPSNPSLKAKHSSSPMPYLNVKDSSHAFRTAEAHSPPSNVNRNNSLGPAAEGRRYLSPQSVGVVDRQTRDSSPKPSVKHYRPNPMLHHHAEDLAQHRNRKLKRKLEDEIAMGDEASNFMQGKQQSVQPRTDQREKIQQGKDVKKDPKRRKQIIADGDPDIEEHFRRSLGKDYKVPDTQNKVSITGSVDEHFKKALGGEVWNKLQTTAASVVKNEPPRDVAAHMAHVLPSYSVAIAAGGAGRGLAYPEGKDTLARVYEAPYLPRDRYNIQMGGIPSHHRRPTKSPPEIRNAPPSAPTVLYPPNQPIAPARQRVKAKAVVYPEAVPNIAEMSHASRAPSLGSKGSSRTISGSSAESLPTVHSKRSPSPRLNCSAPAMDASRGVPITVAIPQSMAYTYVAPHPSTVPITTATAISRSPVQAHGAKSSGNSVSPPLASSDEVTRSPPSSRYGGAESEAPDNDNHQSHEDGKTLT